MELINLGNDFIMAATDINEWNVPNSDDEQDNSEVKQSQGEDKLEIPLKVLLLYSEIEKNSFIELKVKECRCGVKENIVQSSTVVKEQEKDAVNVPAEETNTSPINVGKNAISAANVDIEKENKTSEPSAFDYMEESIDETSHITRKIPKTERFQRKRIGTLENVISDLKRFRDMDNKETGDTDDNSVPAEADTATNKEST